MVRCFIRIILTEIGFDQASVLAMNTCHYVGFNGMYIYTY